jgi:hypothetical protein
MNRLEVESYVKQLSSVHTQQYFYLFIETTSKGFCRFLKRESLINLESNVSVEDYTVKDLYEMVQQKSAELEITDEKQSKSLLYQLLLGLKRGLISKGQSKIVKMAAGIDLASMSVLEKEKVDKAIILAGFYFNCKE